MYEYKTTSSGEIRFNCPFCETHGKTKDSKYHLYVNISKGVFHCFRCGADGRIQSLPEPLLQTVLSIKDSVAPLIFSKEKNKETIKVLPNGFVEEKGRLGDTQFIENYLSYRLKITPKKVRREFLDYYSTVLSIADKSPWVKFISRDMFFEQDYFVLRKPYSRYFMNPTGPKKVFKIGINKLSEGKLVLVEGIIDAMSVYLAYKTPVFALLGKEASSSQIEEILDFSDYITKIYVALDKDARSEAVKLAEKLGFYLGTDKVSLVLLRNAKDPCEAGGHILEKKHSIIIDDIFFAKYDKIIDSILGGGS